MSAVSKLAVTVGADMANSAQAEAEIRKLVQWHQDLWNSHDPAGMTALFTESADLVNVVGMRRRGSAEIFAEYDGIHRTFMRNSVLKVLGVDVKLVASDIAIVHANWEMTGVEKLPGWNIPDVRHGIITYVAVRKNEEWKFEAFHNTDEVPLQLPTNANLK